jgi:hypothetical protein
MARGTGCDVTKEYQPLVWRGAFTDGELDQALPPSAYWHEHAFSDYGQMLYLISVSPVGVELVAHDGRQGVWQPGLAHLYLLEGEHFTAVVPRAQERAERINESFWRSQQNQAGT